MVHKVKIITNKKLTNEMLDDIAETLNENYNVEASFEKSWKNVKGKCVPLGRAV